MKIFFLILFSCFLASTMAAPLPYANAHEFHISRCMIDYNEAEERLQITLHIFIDDLEAALAEQGAEGLFIGTERETAVADTYIERYLQQRMQLLVNQTEVQSSYLGKETSEDLAAVWCYLEVNNINLLQELSVDYSILMELFDDQKNIINIVGPEKKETYFLFTKDKTIDSIQF